MRLGCLVLHLGITLGTQVVCKEISRVFILQNDTEPIEQVQMETLGEVLQEQWSEKSYSTSEEETSNWKELLDSPSLSPSLEASQEDTFSSKFPGGSDLAKVEDIVDAIEADRQLEDIVLKTVEPTKLVGAGLATVLQQELPRGFTEDNLLHMIGPEYQEDLNRMSYEEIMDALTEKVEELEEEAEAQLTPEERAAWDEAIAKEGEVHPLIFDTTSKFLKLYAVTGWVASGSWFSWQLWVFKLSSLLYLYSTFLLCYSLFAIDIYTIRKMNRLWM